LTLSSLPALQATRTVNESLMWQASGIEGYYSFLLAIRSELLDEAPQIVDFLLVLDPWENHFGSWNLRFGIFDVFLEGPFVIPEFLFASE
jgi:hypothetical protein